MESSFNRVSFIGALALYQNKRDRALGLTHLTAKQRGLIWYYNTLQAQIYKDYLRASVNRNALMGIRNRLKRIKREARKAPIERKRELLIEAIKLEELANQWLT